MDSLAVRQVRHVLDRATCRAGTDVFVDLAGLDEQHELTMLELLLAAAGQAREHSATVTVLNPPRRTTAHLADAGVRALRHESAPVRPAGTLTIDLGHLNHAAGVDRVPRYQESRPLQP